MFARICIIPINKLYIKSYLAICTAIHRYQVSIKVSNNLIQKWTQAITVEHCIDIVLNELHVQLRLWWCYMKTFSWFFCAMFVSNYLTRCHIVYVYIIWPTNELMTHLFSEIMSLTCVQFYRHLAFKDVHVRRWKF